MVKENEFWCILRLKTPLVHNSLVFGILWYFEPRIYTVYRHCYNVAYYLWNKCWYAVPDSTGTN